MDNVTHTLIGVTIGTLATRGEEPVPPRSQAILAAVIASNIPDFDIVGKFLYGGSNLAYLLHHRGWTHTVLLSPLMALAGLGILRWILGFKIGNEKRSELPKEQRRAIRRFGRKRLFFIAWVSALIHIFGDFWNDYGVHPFAPFWNRWFYGDFLFIIEPAVWMAIVPLVFFGLQQKWARHGAIVLAALGFGTALFGPQGGFGAFLLLLLWSAAVFFAEWRFRDRFPEGAISAIAVCLVLFTFFSGSVLARAQVRKNIDEQIGKAEVLQTVVSPFPGNPFLWRAIVATAGPKYEYTVRLGTVSILPGVKSPLAEYYGIRMERMAPMVEPTVESGRAVRWLGEYRASTLDYTRLAFESCEFQAFLKFSRVPFWREEPGRTVAGDLRYDHEGGMGFAKVLLRMGHDTSVACPEYDAPWTPPIRFVNQPGP